MCCFYLHSFHIQYSFCAKNCLLLLVYNNLPFPYQEDLNIPNHSVFDCFVFFFQSKNISYTFNFFVLYLFSIFVLYFSFFFFLSFLSSSILFIFSSSLKGCSVTLKEFRLSFFPESFTASIVPS